MAFSSDIYNSQPLIESLSFASYSIEVVFVQASYPQLEYKSSSYVVVDPKTHALDYIIFDFTMVSVLEILSYSIIVVMVGRRRCVGTVACDLPGRSSHTTSVTEDL